MKNRGSANVTLERPQDRLLGAPGGGGKTGLTNATGLESNVTIDGRPADDLGVQPPLVSVFVISRNYETFIGAAIDSIRRQNYPRFECLIIDNGSNDDSLAVISRHIEGDLRFTVLPLDVNNGIMGAFKSDLIVPKASSSLHSMPMTYGFRIFYPLMF